jgi:hypothetical protein
MRQLWYKFLSVALLTAVVSVSLVLAGNGKISGTVKGADGAVVVGANVVVEGTALGGAADVNGNYFILNVPPGTYRVRGSAVGFAPIVLTNVRVGADQIVAVNLTLQSETVGMAEVVVEASRPPVDKSQTSTRTRMGSDEFQSMPIRDVQSLIATSASTFNGFVRGGKQYETKTLVDGIDMTDQYYAAAADVGGGNTPYLTYNGVNRQVQANRSSLVDLNVNSVEEASVLTGGIGSDYASASAGVISYSLAEARSKLSARVDMRISQTGGLDHKGADLYNDQAGYFNQKALLAASTSVADQAKAARFTWTPDKYSYGSQPETKIEAALGSKFSEEGSVYLTLGYFNSYGRLPNEFTRRANASLKVNYNITNDIKLALVGMLEDRGKLFGWKNRTYMDDFRFFLEGVPTWDGANITGSLKLTHVLSPTTFYEVQFSSMSDNSRRGYVDGNSDGQIAIGETGDYLEFADTAQVNRYMASAGNSQFEKFFSPTPRNESGSELGVTLSGASNWKIARPGIYYENLMNNVMTLRADFTSQVTDNHQLRGGLQARMHNLDMKRRAGYIGGVYPSYKNYVDEVWNVKPKEYAAYIQDRMEYAGLIINVGLRLDALDLNGADFKNFFAPFLDTRDAAGGQVRIPVRGENAKVKTFISPRLGVSHPISERASMYFSFSQQQQSQPFSRLYTNYNDFGNPSLPVEVRTNQDPIRSTNYDIGVQWAFYQDYALDVNAYYKDISNYAVTAFVVTPAAPYRSYNINFNFGYADARGVELTLRKNIGQVTDFLSIGGRISYAYSYIKQSVGAGANRNNFTTSGGDSVRYGGGLPFDDTKYWNVIEQNITGSNTTLTGGYDRPHRITFSLSFRFPIEITLSTVGYFQSGFYYPLTLGDPRSRALGESPWTKNVDFRLEKAFTFEGIGRLAIYADLINAFNWTNIVAYQRATEVGQIAFERLGDPTGGPDINRSVTQDASLIYDIPRAVYFGLNFQF